MIKTRYQIPTASPGAILREEKRRGTELGITADQLTSKGQLLPDEIIVAVVRSWLVGQNSAFLFDGFPRTVGQADALEQILAGRGKPLDVAIALDCNAGTLKHRVLNRLVCSDCGHVFSVGWQVPDAQTPCPHCGGHLEKRRDDTLETLEHRLCEYFDKTEPLLAYYEQRGLLRRVDADGPADRVSADIAAILEAA